MNINKMKEKALKKLKGNYGVIVPAILIYFLIVLFFSAASRLIYNENIDILFNILITGLLYMGLLQIVIKTSKGEKTDLKTLFSRTDLFWKATAITIVNTIFTLICLILECIAAKSLMTFICNEANINIMLVTFMIIIGVLLCSAIAIFYIIIMTSWSQVYYILYENEDMPVVDIFSRSMDLMEEYKLDYIILLLSFIGWIIAGIFTFGILYLWLTPYIAVAQTNFYYELKKKEKKES
ncbi:MAG: DUF975 family protein [Bacilli bacterium]|nr:DUF975 family protein [Bacilli bacterium]